MHLAKGFFCGFLADAPTSVFDYDNLKPFVSGGEGRVLDGVVGCESRDKYAGALFLTKVFGEGRVFEVSDVGAVVRFLFRGSHRMEATLTVAEPGFAQSEPMEHIGDDMVFVIEGQIEIEVAGVRTEVLSPGDAMGYPSTIPHRWRVAGDAPARFLMVSAPATF